MCGAARVGAAVNNKERFTHGHGGGGQGGGGAQLGGDRRPGDARDRHLEAENRSVPPFFSGGILKPRQARSGGATGTCRKYPRKSTTLKQSYARTKAAHAVTRGRRAAHHPQRNPQLKGSSSNSRSQPVRTRSPRSVVRSVTYYGRRPRRVPGPAAVPAAEADGSPPAGAATSSGVRRPCARASLRSVRAWT